MGAEFTVNDVMMVFSLLLFSIGYAAQILSWSKCQACTTLEITRFLIFSKSLKLAHLVKSQ